MKTCVEYKIHVEGDGTITPLVGPSDHCSKKSMAIVKTLGYLLHRLRPLF